MIKWGWPCFRIDFHANLKAWFELPQRNTTRLEVHPENVHTISQACVCSRCKLKSKIQGVDLQIIANRLTATGSVMSASLVALWKHLSRNLLSRKNWHASRNRSCQLNLECWAHLHDFMSTKTIQGGIGSLGLLVTRPYVSVFDWEQIKFRIENLRRAITLSDWSVCMRMKWRGIWLTYHSHITVIDSWDLCHEPKTRSADVSPTKHHLRKVKCPVKSTWMYQLPGSMIAPFTQP